MWPGAVGRFGAHGALVKPGGLPKVGRSGMYLSLVARDVDCRRPWGGRAGPLHRKSASRRIAMQCAASVQLNLRGRISDQAARTVTGRSTAQPQRPAGHNRPLVQRLDADRLRPDRLWAGRQRMVAGPNIYRRRF